MKHKLQTMLKNKLQWLLLLAALLGVSQEVWCAWLGNSGVQVDGTWYKTSAASGNGSIDGGNWLASSTAFNGATIELSSSTSFTIGGQFDTYDNGRTDECSWNGSTGIYFKITTTGGTQKIAETKLNIYHKEKSNNNNIWSTNGGSSCGSPTSWGTKSIDISSLSAGSYYLYVYWYSPSSVKYPSSGFTSSERATIVVPCTPPTAGTATANSEAEITIAKGSSVTIAVSGYTGGSSIAWEKSTNRGSSWSDASSSFASFSSGAINTPTWYRATVTKDGCSATSSIAKVNLPTTISVDVSAVSWTNVKIHYWTASGNVTTWTGNAMTNVGNNIYTYVINEAVTGLIINNDGNGNKQTTDITTITLGGNNCYVVNNTAASGSDARRTWSTSSCPSEFTSVTVNDASVCAGSTVTLSKSSTPSESVTWSFSSSNTSVATVSSAGVVTGKAAGSVTITATVSKTDYISKSATCTVTVNAKPSKPTITSYDTPICSGSAPTFKVNSVDGITYRMYAGGSPSGSSVDGDGDEITLTAATINSNTTFTMRATNAAGCYTSSDNATVTVVAGVPTIAASGAGTAVTASGDLCDGSEITLTAPTAFTNTPTQYQWSINSGAYSALSASNTKDYTISGTSNFTVNVKAANVCGTSAASPTTTFSSIGTKASISGQPSNQTVCQNDTPDELTVTASGTNPTYQWYSYTSSGGAGESLIAGAESSSYTPSTTTVGTYYYACKVNACGSYTVRSNIVTFTVNALPTITLTGVGGKSASATYPWDYMTITATTTPEDLVVNWTKLYSGSGSEPVNSVTKSASPSHTYKIKSAITSNPNSDKYTIKANGTSSGCAAIEAVYDVYINNPDGEICD